MLAQAYIQRLLGSTLDFGESKRWLCLRYAARFAYGSKLSAAVDTLFACSAGSDFKHKFELAKAIAGISGQAKAEQAIRSVTQCRTAVIANRCS